MEPNERRRADALDAYWDAVQKGEQSALIRVDTRSAAIIATLANRANAGQVQDAQQRVKQQILGVARNIDLQSQRPPAIPASPAATPKSPARMHRWMYGLAVAAALLVAMIAGYALLGGNDADGPKTVPAAAAPTASPVPTTTAVMLFETTLDADAVPEANTAGAGIQFDRIPVGVTTVWTPYCCTGVMVDFATQGTYTVEAVAPIKVIRNDGQVEDIPANSAVALGPGDAVVSRLDTAFTLTNTGAEPVKLMNWTFIEDEEGKFSGRRLPGAQAMGLVDVQGVERLPGPTVVRMQRVTMPPGSRLVPPAGDYNFVIRLAYTEAGTPQTAVGFNRIDDGPIENNGRVDLEIYVLTLDQTGEATPVPS